MRCAIKPAMRRSWHTGYLEAPWGGSRAEDAGLRGVIGLSSSEMPRHRGIVASSSLSGAIQRIATISTIYDWL